MACKPGVWLALSVTVANQTQSPWLATWGSLHVVQTGEVTEAEVHTGRAPCAQEGRCWRQGCGGQSIQGLRAGAVAPVPLATGRWKVLLR